MRVVRDCAAVVVATMALGACISGGEAEDVGDDADRSGVRMVIAIADVVSAVQDERALRVGALAGGVDAADEPCTGHADSRQRTDDTIDDLEHARHSADPAAGAVAADVDRRLRRARQAVRDGEAAGGGTVRVADAYADVVDDALDAAMRQSSEVDARDLRSVAQLLVESLYRVELARDVEAVALDNGDGIGRIDDLAHVESELSRQQQVFDRRADRAGFGSTLDVIDASGSIGAYVDQVRAYVWGDEAVSPRDILRLGSVNRCQVWDPWVDELTDALRERSS